MKSIQHITSEKYGAATFIDNLEHVHSRRCQPRDIEIVTGRNCAGLQSEIAVDIRTGQGYPPVGVAKGLMFS